MPKKKPMEGSPEVHEELQGFEMRINEFGEIVSNTSVDALNRFLNKHVEDKKFKGLDSIPYAQKGDDDDDDDFDDDDYAEDDDLGFDDDDNEIADLVKNMEKDFPGKGKKGKEFDDFNDEDLIDDYGEEFGEEDDYDFDDDL